MAGKTTDKAEIQGPEIQSVPSVRQGACLSTPVRPVQNMLSPARAAGRHSRRAQGKLVNPAGITE